MRATRQLSAAALLALAVLAAAQGAALGQTARGWSDDSGVTAGADTPGQAATPVSQGGGSSGGRGAGGSVATCTAGDGTVGPVGYQPFPDGGLSDAERRLMAKNGGGGWYVKTCGGKGAAGPYPDDAVYFRNAPPGATGPVVDPEDLARQALQRTSLPAPQISMAPSPDIPQLVNLPTFLWIPASQWGSHAASASAGGVTSMVTAVPQRVVWEMGQGDTVTCNGPGVPYDRNLADHEQPPGHCRFTYPASSARSSDKTFTVTATIEYRVTWSASGASGGGELGISRRSSSTTVQVAEVQVLNINPA